MQHEHVRTNLFLVAKLYRNKELFNTEVTWC